jgi:hypothetical protein
MARRTRCIWCSAFWSSPWFNPYLFKPLTTVLQGLLTYICISVVDISYFFFSPQFKACTCAGRLSLPVGILILSLFLRDPLYESWLFFFGFFRQRCFPPVKIRSRDVSDNDDVLEMGLQNLTYFTKIGIIYSYGVASKFHIFEKVIIHLIATTTFYNCLHTAPLWVVHIFQITWGNVIRSKDYREYV